MEVDSIWPRSDPRVWYDIPLPMLLEYKTFAPRVHARQTLQLVQAVALGTGSLKRGTAQTMMRQLDRAANTGITRRKAWTAKSPEAMAAHLSMMGIGVELVSGDEPT